jgi:hypothetical protein
LAFNAAVLHLDFGDPITDDGRIDAPLEVSTEAGGSAIGARRTQVYLLVAGRSYSKQLMHR